MIFFRIRYHHFSILLLLFAMQVVAACQRSEPEGSGRAQLDTVGFAVDEEDFQAVLDASLAKEGLPLGFPDQPASPAVAAILPHDDYLYAGRTVVHALPHLQAKRWIVFGVCHACRRSGVRDRLLLDDFPVWEVAGQRFGVDKELRERILAGMGEAAVASRERHAAEHSIEALLPWLGAAVEDPQFVPILVPGMEPDNLQKVSGKLGVILAEICRENDWIPGRDLGLLISADAVHYGCEGWGGNGYSPFGCDEGGHAQGRSQDVGLCELLSGPLTEALPERFIAKVWDREHTDYPAYPYRITWCGLYSIPFGLTTTLRWHEELGLPAPAGRFLRYGDSVSDGRLDLAGTRLGVTAPNTLQHWVGYPALVYTSVREDR